MIHVTHDEEKDIPSGTKADCLKDKYVHELFVEQAERTPEAVALVFEDSEMTYRELNAHSNRLAHYLRKRGVGPEVLVGICIERSPEMIVGILGILKAGGAYLPLDSKYPRERLAFMIEDARTPVILTHQRLRELLPHRGAELVCLDSDWQAISLETDSPPVSGTKAENLAYVIYTSGSTGTPKGVMISQRAVSGHCRQIASLYELGPNDRVLQFASLSFDASLEQIFSPLLVGASVILRDKNVWTPSDFQRIVVLFRLTVVDLPPLYFHEWVQACIEAAHKMGNHHLRLIICGGDELRPETIRIWQRTAMSAVRLLNAYGPTEATITSAFFEVNSLLGNDPLPARIPIGRPLPNRKIHILDRYGKVLPIGAPGELCVGGDGLARGYLNRPELTAEKFIPDPFNDRTEAKLYKTGDLARYLPDGNIEFLGRIDQQIKIRGFRIESGEIESILGQHPDVNGSVVLAREDMPGHKRLVAYIAPIPGKNLKVSEIRRFLAGNIPEFMIPSAFVPLERIPLTANGKVNRNALPAPDNARPELESPFVEPRTPFEHDLAEIWADVLGLEQVGVNDNFFELGGHSLLAAMIIARVREACRQELSLDIFFNNPTVAGIAVIVNGGELERSYCDITPLTHANRDTDIPLSFSQERIWFLTELHPDMHAYNFENAIGFKGILNIGILERSLNEIVRRHEIYRTTFIAREGKPEQIIHGFKPFKIEVIDISQSNESEREALAERIIADEFSRHFDLSALPLVRWKLLKISPEKHYLIHTEHHFVHDGWSLNVFLGELKELYNAFSDGKPSPLAEPEFQFADFACWQRQWMQGEVAEKQLSYWKRHLQGYEQVVTFPTDRPRPMVQTFNGVTYLVDLPPELCETLRSYSRRNGLSLYMTMLSAFFVLVNRYTNMLDLCVGSAIANRRMRETEGILGMIINTFALRCDLSGNPLFIEFAGRVRDVCLDAYANQDIPFDKVVEALRPARSLSYSPFYQTMFSFHDPPLSDLDFIGLDTFLMEGLSQAAKCDLEIIVIPRLEQGIGKLTDKRNNGITILWQYNTDLFDGATIERLDGHFRKLLEGIVAGPEMRISELPILTEAERRQLLVEWNDTKRDYPKDKCIHVLFEAQTERTPEAVAVVFEDQQFGYRELNVNSNRLAHYLRSLGVGPETLVGICMERSLEMVVGILGILKAGGAYLPLDPGYPQERLAFMIKDAGIGAAGPWIAERRFTGRGNSDGLSAGDGRCHLRTAWR